MVKLKNSTYVIIATNKKVKNSTEIKKIGDIVARINAGPQKTGNEQRDAGRAFRNKCCFVLKGGKFGKIRPDSFLGKYKRAECFAIEFDECLNCLPLNPIPDQEQVSIVSAPLLQNPDLQNPISTQSTSDEIEMSAFNISRQGENGSISYGTTVSKFIALVEEEKVTVVYSDGTKFPGIVALAVVPRIFIKQHGNELPVKIEDLFMAGIKIVRSGLEN